MSAPPFMKLVVAEYTADVQHLTCEQDGAYWRLLRAMWRAGGSLPYKADKLATICGLSADRWAEIGPDVVALFRINGGELTHKRLTAEVRKVRGMQRTRSDAAKKGHSKKAQKINDAAAANAPKMQPECTHIKDSKIESLTPTGQSLFGPNGPSSSDEPTPGLSQQIDQAFAAWNELAKRNGLPVAKVLDKGRRAAIQSRLRERGLEGWLDALLAVERSKHCLGDNDRGWKADLDFVCQPKSWRRLQEGFYGGSPTVPVVQMRTLTREEWAERMAWHRHDGWWDPKNLGPRPGEPGCRVPADLLAAPEPQRSLPAPRRDDAPTSSAEVVDLNVARAIR